VKCVFSELSSAQIAKLPASEEPKSEPIDATQAVDHLQETLSTLSTSDQPQSTPIHHDEPAPESPSSTDHLQDVFQKICQGKRSALTGFTEKDLNTILQGPNFRFKKGKIKIQGEGSTLLCVASQLGYHHLIDAMLSQGASPILGKPYSRTLDKETRDCFRRYWARNPEQWDYLAGGIPSPLTLDMEQREKERQRLGAERSAERRRLKEDEVTEPTTHSKSVNSQAETTPSTIRHDALKTQLRLSDRERRALAAELRAGLVCWWCYESLRGKVPFERLEFEYCSPDCAHRHCLQELRNETVK